MQIWEALKGAGRAADGRQRTFEPVRRHSRPQGREATFWRPFNPKDTARYMLAAERFERMTRAKGQRVGRLGPVGLEVLRELLRLVDYRTGRLDPSITTLCDRIGRSRDAIVRALANLRGAGFLDWVRRYVPTGNKGAGPQVQQTSNAYRLSLPPIAAKLLGKLARPAPTPEDFAHRQEQQREAHRAMIAGLPLWEQPAQIVEDSSLAAVLARLGRAVAERESAQQSESCPSKIIYGAG